MARNPIVFQNGTLVSSAKVEVGGTVYDVTPAQYEGSTPLSANNLNQLQTNLYDYADEKISNEFIENNSIGYSANYINDITTDTYSSNEIKTNKIWINNKPIYRKVVTDNSISSEVNTGITNCEDIVNMSVYAKQNNSNSWRPIPWLFVQNNSIGTGWWAGGYYFENGKLIFQIGDTLKNISKFIAIFEYTKTTD